MSQDDELFQDLEDYSALDESPTFDFEEDPLPRKMSRVLGSADLRSWAGS